VGYKYLYLNLHVIVFEGRNASNLKNEIVAVRYWRNLPVLSHCPLLHLRVDCVISVMEKKNLFKAEVTSLNTLVYVFLVGGRSAPYLK
jgi:hypothetical protein